MTDFLHSVRLGEFPHVLSAAPPLAGRAAQARPAATEGQALPDPSLGGGGSPPPQGPGFGFLFIIVGFFILMIFMSSMTQRRERRKREELLSSLGRNDRVVTAGGVLGTIVELRDDEVVLRVDDAGNTRITFTRSSIQGVVKKHASASGRPEGLEPAETVKG